MAGDSLDVQVHSKGVNKNETSNEQGMPNVSCAVLNHQTDNINAQKHTKKTDCQQDFT
jgi:hypothetical protein